MAMLHQLPAGTARHARRDGVLNIEQLDTGWLSNKVQPDAMNTSAALL